MNYVILLRGVNAGGKRRVPQDEFRRVLESLGFGNVQVYINSGNAVFATDIAPRQSDIQTALEAAFGFEIPTLLLSSEQIISIANAIPDSWTNDPSTTEKSGQKSDVIYLFDAVDSPDILDRLGYRPDVETMHYVPGAVITTITRANQSKGSLQNVIGTRLYQHMTIRNVNTARKLAELVSV